MLVQGGVLQVLFTCLDIQWHDANRRLVNQAFTMSNLTKYEAWVDDVILAFGNQLDNMFARTGKAMDMFEWFAFFSMDMASTVTFGEPVGFIAAGKDINNGMLKRAQKHTQPWLYVSALLQNCPVSTTFVLLHPRVSLLAP